MGTHVWTNENQTGGAILPENFAQNVDEAFVKVWNQVAGFTIGASGNTAGRSTYDAESTGFVYYDSQAELFYQKQSDTSGDWSDGFKVGTTKDNFSATAAPTATDDSASGYSVGSLWTNVSTEIAYICMDATATAAEWIVIGKKNNYAATTDPGSGDDSGDGYSVGSNWVNTTDDKAFVCLDATASAAVWQEIGAGGRECLTANRTYYLSTTGSDSNDGLSSGSPFLTLDHAFDVIAGLDLKTYTVTVTLANGTYSGATSIGAKWLGGSSVIVESTSGTPGDVTLSHSGNLVTVTVPLDSVLQFRNLTVTNTAGDCFRFESSVNFQYNNVTFGAVGAAHIHIFAAGARVTCAGNYTIIGGGQRHINNTGAGYLRCDNRTVTLTGMPNFSSQFIYMAAASRAICGGMTFLGLATGQRHNITENAICANGGSTTYFPGNSAGVVDNGGLLV